MNQFMFRRRLIAVLLFATLVISGYAQNTKQNIFPVSPEVATLGKFVDTPVGTYSGVPDITIPVYTVNHKSISIPLNLSYHAGGIKVEEEASWVGLGWDMFFGGFITQSVIGRPDGSDYLQSVSGFEAFKNRFTSQEEFMGRPEQGSAGWLCGDPSNYSDSFEVIHALLEGHGRPDVYTFSFGGRSGKFVINPETNVPIVLDKKEELRIEKLPDLEGWVVKTLDGLTFYFTNRVYGTDQLTMQLGRISTNTWKLSRIESVDGTVFTFEYTPGYSEGFFNTESHKSNPYIIGQNPPPPTPAAQYHLQQVVKTFSYDLYLKTIITPSERIEFNLEDRQDMKGNTLSDDSYSVKRLREITVKDVLSGKIKHAFGFDYDYFSNTEVVGTIPVPQPGTGVFIDFTLDHLGKRLKLVRFYEIGYDSQGNATEQKPFEFQYNESIPLPMKNSLARDYWGYYNGVLTNASSLPDLTHLFFGQPILSTIPIMMLNTPYKANRGMSASHMQAGILQKIKLPTGGTREFTFEPHSFSNFTFYGADQIVTQEFGPFYGIDQNYPGSTTGSVDVAMPTQTVDMNFEVYFSRGNAAQGLDFDDIKASTVTLVSVTNGGTVTYLKTWRMDDIIDNENLFNQQGFIKYTEKVSVNPVANATLKIGVNLPDVLGPQNTSTNNATVWARCSYRQVFANGTGQSTGGGLRIANVKLKDANDNLLYSKDYTYEGGVLLSPPSFLTMRPFTHKFLECRDYNQDGIYEDAYVWRETGTLYQVNAESSISLNLNPNGGHVGYSYVNETEVSAQSNNGKIRSRFQNVPNQHASEFPENPNMDNGLLLERSYLTNSNILVRKENFNYTYLTEASSIIRGYDIMDSYTGPDQCGACGFAPLGNFFLFTNRFTLKYYPIKSRYYSLTSKTESVYDVSTGLAAETQSAFVYNSLGQVITSTTTSSTADVLRKEYKHAVDYLAPFPYNIIYFMQYYYYLPVMEEKGFFNNDLQKTIMYKYSNSQTSAAKFTLESILETSAGGSEVIRLKNLKFDQYANPKHQIATDGVESVFLWGRGGTVPTAKIEGIPLSSIESTLVSEAALATLEGNALKTELLKLYAITGTGLITLYLYNDKNQLVEMIDPNQQSTYYAYDEFGRLVTIKDHHQNLVKHFTYHLQD